MAYPFEFIFQSSLRKSSSSKDIAARRFRISPHLFGLSLHKLSIPLSSNPLGCRPDAFIEVVLETLIVDFKSRTTLGSSSGSKFPSEYHLFACICSTPMSG